MNERLTTEELEAICKRAEATTGKEWTDFDGSKYSGLVCEYDRLTEDVSRVIAECKTQADAEFIACAREDIPALLDEIELLNSELVVRETSHIDLYCENKELKDTVKSLRQMLEQLELSVIGHCDESTEPYEIATGNDDY